MKAHVARDWDGRLTLFRGERPEPFRGDLDRIDWRCTDGCRAVASLPRDMFPEIRCGECAEVTTVGPVGGSTP